MGFILFLTEDTWTSLHLLHSKGEKSGLQMVAGNHSRGGRDV